MPSDTELLRRYLEDDSEEAFTALVQRHLNLVYGLALRKVGGDAHLAEDVTQKVFADLAVKAPALRRHPVLSGWLFTSTRYAAAQVVRTERRRIHREQVAHTMNAHSPDPGSADWERLRPLLDDLIGDLGAGDREAVLLRFYEGKSLREVGDRLALSEDGARSRVDRALDKLYSALAQRGVKSSSGALAAALAAQASAAAPPGLAALVSSSVLSGKLAGGATGGLLWFFMSTTKTGVALAVAIVALGTAIYQGRKTEALRETLETRDRDLALARTQIAEARRQARAIEQRGNLAIGTAESKDADIAPKVVPSPEPLPEEAALIREEGRAMLMRMTARRRATSERLAREIPAEMDAVARFHRRLELAAEFTEAADFQGASKLYNAALVDRPPGLPVPESALVLQAKLIEESDPVLVQFNSDGLTRIHINDYGSIGKVASHSQGVPPGNYEIVGRRIGFADVVIPLQIRSTSRQPIVLTVICTEPLAP